MANHDMICICESEGKRAAESLRIEVCRRLRVKPEDLAVASLLSLSWQIGVDVSVMSDMWSGVSAGGEYVECDLPLDGIAYLWRWHADKNPAAVSVTGQHVGHDDLARLSEQQLVTESRLEAAYREHRDACSECDTGTGWRLCSEGKRIGGEWGDAARALNDKWGMPDHEVASRYWGYFDPMSDGEDA